MGVKERDGVEQVWYIIREKERKKEKDRYQETDRERQRESSRVLTRPVQPPPRGVFVLLHGVLCLTCAAVGALAAATQYGVDSVWWMHTA